MGSDIRSDQRFRLVDLGKQADDEYETPELVKGLTSQPKSIPCCFYYDDQGSLLYEDLCRQPEYYLTRKEWEILSRHANDIVENTGPCDIVELGSGNPQKTKLLLDAFLKTNTSVRFFPIDINRDSIERGATQLHQSLINLEIHGFAGTYAQGTAGLPPRTKPRLFLFMGSSIGNMTDHEIRDLLTTIRSGAKTGDLFLVGADLDKHRDILEAAYNDEAGFAVRVQLNILQHLNWKYDGDIVTAKFSHLAFHNPALMQMEAYVKSLQDQSFTLKSLNLSVGVEAGETIQTQVMRKFDLKALTQVIEAEGFDRERTWFDSDEWFSVSLFRMR